MPLNCSIFVAQKEQLKCQAAGGEGSFTLNPGTFREPEQGGIKTFKGTGGDNFDIRPGAEKSFELPDNVG